MSLVELEPRLRIIRVPIERLHPCPWNPNFVPDRTYAAIGESLEDFGQVDPVKVRPHPVNEVGELVGDEGSGVSDTEWQVIDGEHRWKIMVASGETEVECIPLDLDDAAAKKLTVILNETRGEADTVPMAQLLFGLQQSGASMESLVRGLPFKQAQLDELLKIGSIDWGDFAPDAAEQLEEHVKAQAKNAFTVFLAFDQAQRERYDTFSSMIVAERGDDYTAEEAVVDALETVSKTL